MFGTYSSQKFGLKGAETNWFLEFIVHLLDTHRARLPFYALWRRACASLLLVIDGIREREWVYNPGACQETHRVHNVVSSSSSYLCWERESRLVCVCVFLCLMDSDHWWPEYSSLVHTQSDTCVIRTVIGPCGRW